MRPALAIGWELWAKNRLGLSVTAKNEQKKWARVWLFLTVDDGKQQVESQPDTTTKD